MTQFGIRSVPSYPASVNLASPHLHLQSLGVQPLYCYICLVALMFGKSLSSRHGNVVTVTINIINDPNGNVNAICTTCDTASMGLSTSRTLRHRSCIGVHGLFPRPVIWEHCNVQYISFDTLKYRLRSEKFGI